MFPNSRLRELRKAAGLTQTELAQRTGVSQPTISDLENDRLTLNVQWMRAIARELDCLPVDLLSDQDNPDRLTEEERELVHRYRTAANGQRTLIYRIAEPVQEWRGPEPDRKRA